MILLLILWVLYSVAEAYEDSQYTFMLWHGPTVYPRLLTGLLVVWSLMGWPLSWHHATLGFVLAAVFWFVFELARNLFSERYFFYIGTTSWWDRKLKRYELPVFWLRLWLVALSFCIHYYHELTKHVWPF